MVYHSPYSTPEGTPLTPEVIDASTPWSDVLLEDLRALQFSQPAKLRRGYSHRTSYKTRLRSWSKVLWLSVFAVVGLWWALHQGDNIREGKKETLVQHKLDGLQFIAADHPYIRVRLPDFFWYVGRWLATADETHKDGSFPGVYFDFAFDGSTTVLLSLHNEEPQRPSTKQSRAIAPTLPFLPLTNTSHAAPVSLLVRIDEEEYAVLPNATSIVSICPGNVNPGSRHDVRIIAPMVGGNSVETLQIHGIWIDEGGQLLPHEERTSSSNRPSQDDKHLHTYRRMLEIVTDIPGSTAGRNRGKNIGADRIVLGGVLGWEYLLGEMFGSDHVMVGEDGMCLTSDCIEGQGNPAGLADVFFQSGPAGSPQFSQPWFFQEYTPDVIVMNVGASDWDSFQTHTEQYNKTLWELSVQFEETYVSMIKAIRTLAYPKYSAATIDSSRYIYSARNAAAGVPIFIMRPFRGQLEQATHAVVDRLQQDGDKSVFWLDTSGWLNTEVDFAGRAEDQDFFLDEGSSSKRWRLTERGNQRVAILLHMHVCRYLARDVEKCAFLPSEIYRGKALDHEAIRFSEFLEDERERKLKRLFWT